MRAGSVYLFARSIQGSKCQLPNSQQDKDVALKFKCLSQLPLTFILLEKDSQKEFEVKFDWAQELNDFETWMEQDRDDFGHFEYFFNPKYHVDQGGFLYCLIRVDIFIGPKVLKQNSQADREYQKLLDFYRPDSNFPSQASEEEQKLDRILKIRELLQYFIFKACPDPSRKNIFPHNMRKFGGNYEAKPCSMETETVGQLFWPANSDQKIQKEIKRFSEQKFIVSKPSPRKNKKREKIQESESRKQKKTKPIRKKFYKSNKPRLWEGKFQDYSRQALTWMIYRENKKIKLFESDIEESQLHPEEGLNQMWEKVIVEGNKTIYLNFCTKEFASNPPPQDKILGGIITEEKNLNRKEAIFSLLVDDYKRTLIVTEAQSQWQSIMDRHLHKFHQVVAKKLISKNQKKAIFVFCSHQAFHTTMQDKSLNLNYQFKRFVFDHERWQDKRERIKNYHTISEKGGIAWHLLQRPMQWSYQFIQKMSQLSNPVSNLFWKKQYCPFLKNKKNKLRKINYFLRKIFNSLGLRKSSVSLPSFIQQKVFCKFPPGMRQVYEKIMAGDPYFFSSNLKKRKNCKDHQRRNNQSQMKLIQNKARRRELALKFCSIASPIINEKKKKLRDLQDQISVFLDLNIDENMIHFDKVKKIIERAEDLQKCSNCGEIPFVKIVKCKEGHAFCHLCPIDSKQKKDSCSCSDKKTCKSCKEENKKKAPFQGQLKCPKCQSSIKINEYYPILTRKKTLDLNQCFKLPAIIDIIKEAQEKGQTCLFVVQEKQFFLFLKTIFCNKTDDAPQNLKKLLKNKTGVIFKDEENNQDFHSKIFTLPWASIIIASVAGLTPVSNLSVANYLIFCDPLIDPQDKSTIMAKVYNQAQKKKVFIKHLVMQKTIEEEIHAKNQRMLSQQRRGENYFYGSILEEHIDEDQDQFLEEVSN